MSTNIGLAVDTAKGQTIVIPEGTDFVNPGNFPLHIFPPQLEELIRAAEKFDGMPSAYLATSILYAFATALGNAWKLEVKPGTIDNASIYLAIIGNPNLNKSGPLKRAVKPIAERDNDRYKEYEAQRGEYEQWQKLSQEEKDSFPGPVNEEPPVWERRMINDATIEKLVIVHQQNPRGISTYYDELAGWISNMFRYKSDSQNFWLSVWSGQPTTVDRVSGEPRRILDPCMSVAGTIQPGRLSLFSKDDRDVNGFIDRMLFAFPEGLKKPVWLEDSPPVTLWHNYDRAVNKVMDIPFSVESSHILKLTADARKKLFRFFNEENSILANEANENGKTVLAGGIGKMDSQARRICLIIAAIEWAFSEQSNAPTSVGISTVSKAIEVTRYFRKQTEKVHSFLFEATPFDKMDKLQERVYAALPATFKKAEGEKIAKDNGMPPRTFARFIRDKDLFEKVSRGIYDKAAPS